MQALLDLRSGRGGSGGRARAWTDKPGGGGGPVGPVGSCRWPLAGGFQCGQIMAVTAALEVEVDALASIIGRSISSACERKLRIEESIKAKGEWAHRCL